MELSDTSATDVQAEKRRSLLLGAVLVGVLALTCVDVVADLRDGGALAHVVVEALLGTAAAGALVLVVRRLIDLRSAERSLRDQTASLRSDLSRAADEVAHWRREARGLLDGLGAAIDAQFERWSLTPAEKDIALLLLKGLSHKEIASMREVGEATVRQQARSLYRKAGLTGRHELSAFFLEDLLLPRGTVLPK